MADNFTIRRAYYKDIPELHHIMHKSIQLLQSDYLSPAQVRASKEVMGMDTQLIKDGTYFAVLAGDIYVGCGGWSMRDTLYGGDHTKGRSPRLLDPKTEAARIRAMYTHPDWVRRGIGSLIITHCENEARKAGFRRAEMMATLAGQPLYAKHGYEVIERIEDETSNGVKIPLIRMGKDLVG